MRKIEPGRPVKLKLRKIRDKASIDLGLEARKVVNKRKVFTYFLLYRILAAFIMPLIMITYITIGRYVDSGFFIITPFSGYLMAVSAANSLIIIFIFSRKTYGIRHVIKRVAANNSCTDDDIVPAYKKIFSIPIYITVCECVLSVAFILVPVIVLNFKGIHPESVAIKELLIAWWLGALSLSLVSYMFNQGWVEKTLTRLYDYGIRISVEAGIKRNTNIYIRISIVIGLMILTLILLYTNMLYMLASRVPGYTSLYMTQVSVMSLIILAVIYFFFRLIFQSIKRSFDILNRKMKMVQDGDYSVSILNQRDDQIGQLYDAFDYLVSTLNNVLTSLEDQVQRRTAKLEEVTSKIAKYVSPQLYSKIYSEDSDLTLSYTRKKLTIFFSDIAGFTNISENLAPEDLSRILNQYLDAMAEIAQKWGGTIDKYIGDAILIFFGDPEFTNDKDHAVRCVNMGIDMLGKLEHLQVEWNEAGVTFPLQIRIGINTGFCTVGNFGSESRMDYTVIGGAVNLASRLQTAAKVNDILISDTTYLLVKDDFNCTSAGEMSLKGIDHPVAAYSVESSSSQTVDLTDIHIPGLDLRIDPSGMTAESRMEILDILKRTYNSLGRS